MSYGMTLDLDVERSKNMVTLKGIDVSNWQGDIDWKKVKESGKVDFAIIRAGSGTSYIDEKLYDNVKGCEENGIPYGLYWFSYAMTIEQAKKEAELCYKAIELCRKAIKGFSLSYPVFLDQEADEQVALGKKVLADMAKTFCEYLKARDIYVGFYSYLSWVNNIVGDVSAYDLWVAHISSKCGCTKPYTMWQYSYKGRIPGIAGDVDLDYCYVDYPSIIKSKDKPVKKTINELVVEVWEGKWGNGNDRYERLTKAGYNYDQVQSMVTKIGKVAEEVWAGKWGNGLARKKALTDAGYDYDTVQAVVNMIR